MLVTGEPEIGKTRLLRHFAEMASVPVVWDACPEHIAAPPLWPWEQVLRAVRAGCSDRLVPGRLLSCCVARLPEAAAALLSVAAAAGRHFDVEVVAEAASVEIEVALEAIDAAVAAGLVVENEHPLGWIPRPGGYAEFAGTGESGRRQPGSGPGTTSEPRRSPGTGCWPPNSTRPPPREPAPTPQPDSRCSSRPWSRPSKPTIQPGWSARRWGRWQSRTGIQSAMA